MNETLKTQKQPDKNATKISSYCKEISNPTFEIPIPNILLHTQKWVREKGSFKREFKKNFL